MPGKTVSSRGSLVKNKETDNQLIEFCPSMVLEFLGKEFLSVNKLIIFLGMDKAYCYIVDEWFYSDGNNLWLRDLIENTKDLKEIEKIINLLDQKIRPAVAKWWYVQLRNLKMELLRLNYKAVVQAVQVQLWP